MSVSKWLGSVLLLALVVSVPVRAEETMKEAPKPAETEKPVKKEKPAKLTKPWSELNDLTDEQKTKITEIHRKALDEKKAIEAKEKEDILALLTDAQKAEVEKLGEKKTVEKKKDDKKEESKKEDAKPAQEKAAQ